VRQVLKKELGLKIVECDGTLEGGDVLWTGIDLIMIRFLFTRQQARWFSLVLSNDLKYFNRKGVLKY